MTTRRKITALAGVAVAALAFSGCAGGDGGGGDGPVELRVVSMTSQRAALERMFELYREVNPDVTFALSTAEADQYNTAIRAQMGGNNAPDLMMVFPGSGNATSVEPLAEAGLLVDQSDRDWVGDVPDSFAPLNQLDGKTYIRSYGYGTIGTVYNRDAFDELGLEVPTTWSELLSVCEEAKAAGKIPIALGLATGWNTQLVNYGLVASTVYGPEPGFTDEQLAGDASFEDSAGWNEAFEKYMQLRDNGCFIDGAEGTTYDQAKNAVASGDALMITLVLDGVPSLRELDPEVNYGMFPLPGTDSAADVYAPIGVGPGLGVNARSRHQEAALDFVDFVAQEGSLREWADALGIVPGIKDVPVELAEGFEPMAELLSSDHVAPYPDQRWPSPEVQSAHFAAVQNVYTDQATIADALRSMDAAFDAAR
ncbi:ABC transporter substrate-binding protein [Amycolatopsis dongchuanensis]|uniref:Extracellular solute-binding protein n=1 Tax=Amycolatopsis dongchuanensis TaxID=1070866 RepID=A0ABP9Q9G1_9PSEU